MKVKSLLLVALLSLTAVFYPLLSAGESGDKVEKIELNQSNLVILRGEINSASVATAIKALKKLDSNEGKLHLSLKQQPIYIFVSSPGGEIQAGLELFEAIHGLKRPVHTISSFSASMAFQLVQNAGMRYVLSDAVLLSHRASGGFEGAFGGERPSPVDARYNFWLERLTEMDEQTVKRTKGKQTLEGYRKQYSSDMILTGKQAVEQGYADALVHVSCAPDLDGKSKHATSFMGFRVTYELHKCPLITEIGDVSAEGNSSVLPIGEEVLRQIQNKFIESMSNNYGVLGSAVK
jgi:ATP-dependent Clp protease protease subunit